MKMKLIMENWNRFVLSERVKPSSFYGTTFNEFKANLESHINDIWIFFDTETTGLHYEEDYVQVTELAAVGYVPKATEQGYELQPVQGGVFNVKAFLEEPTISQRDKQRDLETKIASGEVEKPEDYDSFTIDKILKMTAYDDTTSGADYKVLKELLDDFDQYIERMKSQSPSGNVVFVAQNAPYDVAIMNTAYERLGRQSPDYDVWDTKGPIQQFLIPVFKEIDLNPNASPEDKGTAQRAKAISRNSGKEYFSSSLGHLTKAFKIENEKWHQAIADVENTAEMFVRMMKFMNSQGMLSTFKTNSTFDPEAGRPHPTRAAEREARASRSKK